MTQDNFKKEAVQVEYSIFSVCHDVKQLVDDFDNEKSAETYFQLSEDIRIAAARLASLSDVLQHFKGNK